MKKTLSKILLSCAAVMSLSAVMAVSAFAADDISATYVAPAEGATNPSVTIATDSPAYTKDQTSQGTIIIYKGDSATATPTQDNIVFIDQKEIDNNNKGWASVPLPAKVVETNDDWKGTYVVKMGGSAGTTIATGLFNVGEGGTTPVGDVVYGNVDDNPEVDSTDAALIVQKYLGKITFTEEQLKAANVDGEGEVDTTDAALVIQFYLDKIQKFPVEEK